MSAQLREDLDDAGPRLVIVFQLHEVEHRMLAAANEGFDDARESLLRQFPEATAILESGFPFKRHGDEGEWKTERGDTL